MKIATITDSCFRVGHFAVTCSARTDVYNDPSPVFSKQNNTRSNNTTCNRCGRDTHSAIKCLAETDVDGYYLSDSDEDENFSMPSNSEKVKRATTE